MHGATMKFRIKIILVGADWFLADGQTDITWVIVAFAA